MGKLEVVCRVNQSINFSDQLGGGIFRSVVCLRVQLKADAAATVPIARTRGSDVVTRHQDNIRSNQLVVR